MPTDDANVLALAQAIGKIGQDIENQDCPLSNSARQDLIRYAERLAIAAREPEENLYFQATQVRSLDFYRVRGNVIQSTYSQILFS